MPHATLSPWAHQSKRYGHSSWWWSICCILVAVSFAAVALSQPSPARHHLASSSIQATRAPSLPLLPAVRSRLHLDTVAVAAAQPAVATPLGDPAPARGSWRPPAGPAWLWLACGAACLAPWVRRRGQRRHPDAGVAMFAMMGAPTAPRNRDTERWAEDDAEEGNFQGAPGQAPDRPSGRDAYEMLLQPYPYTLAYATMRREKGKRSEMMRRLNALERHAMDRVMYELRQETYQFTLVDIKDMTSPYTNKTPLKKTLNKRQVIPENDLLLLHAMANVLQTIYEPTFENSSYGYRPDRGCHDALQSIKDTCTFMDYWVVGDLHQALQNMDLEALDYVLREEITDDRFVQLVNNAVNAGHLNVWQIPTTSIVGVPEGSVLANILCNIVLDRLDKFVDAELRPMYTRGVLPPPDRRFERLAMQARFAFSKHNLSGSVRDLRDAQGLHMEALNLPTDRPRDPSYRRLHYARYGPHFVIGLSGREDEARHIEAMLTEFFRCIGLRTPVLRVQEAMRPIIFLGTEIMTFRKHFSNRVGVKMNAPVKHIVYRMSEAGLCDVTGRSTASMRLYGAEKDMIVGRYVVIYLSILNYYSFTANYNKIARYFFMILRNSCAKVLAAKYKFRSIRKVILSFGKHLGGTTKVALPDPLDVQRVSSFSPGPTRFPTLL